jgi:hypothetical protein
MIIEVIDRLDLQGLIANFFYSGALDELLAILTLVTIALVSAEDDDGASVNDIRCIGRRD